VTTILRLPFSRLIWFASGTKLNVAISESGMLAA
jgi:hypothetical protein